MILVAVCTLEASVSASFAMRDSDVPAWQARLLRIIARTRDNTYGFLLCFGKPNNDHSVPEDLNDNGSTETVDDVELKVLSSSTVVRDDSILEFDEESFVIAEKDIDKKKSFNSYLWLEQARLIDTLAQVSIPIAFVVLMVNYFKQVL